MERAYDRMEAEFGNSAAVETFSAAGVYDKVGLLVILALLTGAVGYATDSIGLALLGLVAGLVFYMVGLFKPATAHVMAPLYALAEGLALGAITASYAQGSNGVAPLAILFTAGVFLGALVVFRSGLVKVTSKFVTYVLMASVGFILVLLGGMLGLFPGLSGGTGLLVVGIIGLALGVAYLFIDFHYIEVFEERHAPVQAEWFGALLLMASLVMVYINILRILASRRR